MQKNIVFIGAGRIVESIIENLLNASDHLFSEPIKLHFIGHQSENPQRIETFPIKGLIETYKTSLLAKSRTFPSNIIMDENAFSLSTDALDKADMIIFTAALFPLTTELQAARKMGLGREAQLKKNIPIIEFYAKEIVNKAKENIPITLSTNPVDVFSEYLRELTHEKYIVLGLGGGVDTLRFKYLLSKKLNISPFEIEGFVGFMHNQLMMPIMNTIKVKGKSIQDYSLSQSTWDEILHTLKDFGSFVSDLSQKYQDINAGDANTPGAVIANMILSYLGKQEQVASYNFKSAQNVTGFQQPVRIKKNDIALYEPIHYMDKEQQLIKQIHQTILSEVEKLKNLYKSE